MIHLEDFSIMGQNFHLNSMPRICGSFKTKDYTAHAMSRLECGYVTEKFKPYIRTVCSESVRTCFQRLRTNFVKSEVVAKEILLIIEHREFTDVDYFLFTKIVPELSTTVMI
jgi:hypothetical protein